jgi:nucleoside-diphosphate-sugar epimerase
MRKEKVVITGGCGFLGTNTTKRFLDSGFETHVFCKEHGTHVSSGANGPIAHEVDIRNKEQVAEAMASVRPEYVIHLAASNIQAGVITS